MASAVVELTHGRGHARTPEPVKVHEPTRSSMQGQRQLKLLPAAAWATKTGPFLTVSVLNHDQFAVAQFFRRWMSLHDPDHQFGPIGEAQED